MVIAALNKKKGEEEVQENNKSRSVTRCQVLSSINYNAENEISTGRSKGFPKIRGPMKKEIARNARRFFAPDGILIS